MITLTEALTTDGVTVRYYTYVKDAERIFDVTVHCEGRTLSFQSRQSSEAPLTDPSPAELLGPLIRNAMDVEQAGSYKRWASRLSDDPSEWLTQEHYRENLKIAKSLRTVLGAEKYERYSPLITEHDD